MTGHDADDPRIDIDSPKASFDDAGIEAPRRLLAVLFTDIVGSTELATALGDQRWRELVERHNAAVRACIARFGGREVDTAGDSFFAVFDMAFTAVECALDAVREVRRIGLRIRAGVHMGECVDAGTTVRGVTVHIGARVAAKATAGEVLISSTVRDLLAGAGLRFDERGEHVLKGVDGRWRIYAVHPPTVDEAADLPPLIEAPAASAAAGRKRRALVAGVVALALAGATVAYVVTRGGGAVSVAADSVAALDAKSGRVLQTTAVGHRPVGVAASSAGVWVANSIDRSVSRVEAQGDRVETIPLESGPTEVAIGGSLVWVVNADAKTVTRISASTGRPVGEPIEAGNGLADIAVGAGGVWVTHSLDGSVWKIDPASGKRLASATVGLGVRGIAASASAVWATSAASGTATQIDPASGAIRRVVNVGRGASAVAIGAGGVWVANTVDQTVSRIDPASGSVRATIKVGRGARAIAVVRGRVFVANELDGTISMIDGRNDVQSIDIGNAPMGLAGDGDRIWVSVRGGIESYRGGTLRVGMEASEATIDPAFSFDRLGFAITPAAYDGLVSFKKVGGAEGSELVPNLAEDIRPPTDGGKTYSFTLRSGLRYSDGSPVRTSDVRASFERILSNESYGRVFLAGLAGADRCRPGGTCDLSSSVVADDAARTVVIKLRRPFADFPSMLAHPILSILPAKAPRKDAGFAPIPGTGPYRIAEASKSAVTLVRNPHFRERGLAQPDGYVDRIEIRLSGTPAQNIQAVRDGRLDWTLDLRQVDDLPPGAATEAASQIHHFDIPSILYASLNTRVPPFNDVRARRALNLALDRGSLSRRKEGTIGGVTCQVFGKNVFGYRPYCPYTSAPNSTGVWSAPDIATAQRLVRESGTAGQTVTVWIDSGGDHFRAKEHRHTAPYFAAALRAIGYKALVRRVSEEDYYAPFLRSNSTHQIALTGWIADYPAASSFLTPLLVCPDTFTRVTGLPSADLFNLGRFCSKPIDAKIERALSSSADSAALADLWHAIDRLVTDAAPWVAYATYREATFVSKRVGNVLTNGVYGPLMTQMWVVNPRSNR